jgi:hypothetical protein
VLVRPVKERMGEGGRKGTAVMGGTLYNGAGEGRLRESGRREGCHTAGEDVGGLATIDGGAPAGSGPRAVVAGGRRAQCWNRGGQVGPGNSTGGGVKQFKPFFKFKRFKNV